MRLLYYPFRNVRKELKAGISFFANHKYYLVSFFEKSLDYHSVKTSMFNNGTPGTCNNHHVIIHITTQYNISCLIIYVLRDLHLIPMPNLKVFFLNTFQFTTQSGYVCFMHAHRRQFRNRN